MSTIMPINSNNDINQTFIMKYLLSVCFAVLSYGVFSQPVFTLRVQANFNDLISDTLYQVEILASELPSEAFTLSLELVDVAQNSLLDNYLYYLHNEELCNTHDLYIRQGQDYVFLLGTFSRSVFGCKAFIVLKSQDKNLLFNTEIPFN